MSASAPRTVAVCGSCTTRDNFNSRFNEDYRRWYDVVLSASQSSMIALMSPPVTLEPSESDPLGEYDVWTVRSDLSREFLAGLAEAKPDFLLLDFFGDVYFGALRLDDGRYVTDNRWKLWRTAQYARWKEAGTTTRVRPLEDPDAYLELWVEAMDRFAAFVAEHCPDTQVIVHRGFNTNKAAEPDRSGTFRIREIAPRLAALDVAAANELWSRFDEHAITAYGWDSIDLRAEGYSSWKDHPWGPFWVHYTPDYYHRFLAEMHLRDLRTRLTGDLVDQVELIAAAGNERILNQATFLDAVVTAQDARIRELTDQGLMQAVRGAWSRQRRRRSAQRPGSGAAK